MVDYRVWLLFLLNLTWSNAEEIPKNIRFIGVMKGTPGQDAVLVPNVPWSFTIFGKNLPKTGWLLTSRSSCKDLNTENKDEVDIALKTTYPTDEIDPVYRRKSNHVTLRAMDGVPFKYDSREKFLICHPDVSKGVPMVVRSKYKRIDWWKCIFVVLFLIGSAFCSGTSIAFFRYNIDELMSITEASFDETEKLYAQNVVWYRRKSNYLICCFAAANCIMNVMLVHFCEDVFANFRDVQLVTMVASTCLTVTFGEILPQGIGSRYGLWVASQTRYCTLFLFIIMAPFAWPLSKLTDLILGREARQVLSTDQLKTLLTHHASHLCTDQEGEIFRRTVKFQDMTIRDIMRPLKEVFALSDTLKYTPDMALLLVERGMYSRIPVFYGKDSRNIYGCINMAELIDKPKYGQTLAEIMSQTTSHLRFAPIDMRLQALSEEMKTGEHHMCVVFDYRFGKNEVIGLVTSEDVWEQLFGDIQDDRDLAFGNKRTGIRIDQATLDWYKNKTGPFTCNQQLEIIQQMHNFCPALRWMGLDVHAMRNLFPSTLKILVKDKKLDICPMKMYVICIGEFKGEVNLISADGSTSEYKVEKQYQADTATNGRVYVVNSAIIKTIAGKYVASFPSFPSDPPSLAGSYELDTVTQITAIQETKYFIIDEKQIVDAIGTTIEEDGPEYFEPQLPKARKSPHNTENKSKKGNKNYKKTPPNARSETNLLLADTQLSITEDSTQPSDSLKNDS